MKMPDLNTVSQIVRGVAMAEVMPAFQALADHQVYEKRPGEVVTEIDLIAERLLIQQLTSLLPGSKALGEESVENDPSLMDLVRDRGPVWIIDPIDGTQNYANGNPHFALMVSFRADGTTQLAWIYAPVRDVMISAQSGQGAWMSQGGNALGKRLSAQGIGQAVAELHGSLGHRLSKSHRAIGNSTVHSLPTLSDRLRCCGQEYMALAQGHIQFLQYGVRLKPWDHSAGVLIATEAGYHAAFMEDESAYDTALLMPGGTPEGYLMIAPDYQSWSGLRELLWHN